MGLPRLHTTGWQGGPSWAGSGQEWAGIVVCTYSDSSSSEWLRLGGILRNILSLKSLVYIQKRSKLTEPYKFGQNLARVVELVIVKPS